MIKITDISKKISSDFVLNIDNLVLEDSTNYILRGKNGSGKTTFIKIVMGLLSKDSGKIEIKGIVCGFMGTTHMIDFLTPREYFFVAGKSNGLKKSQVIERYNYINSFFNRKYFDESKKIADYSDGNRQLIGLIACCVTYASFIFLDEPFNFLDDDTQKSFINLISDLNAKQNISFIYSDNMHKDSILNCKTLLIQDGTVNLG